MNRITITNVAGKPGISRRTTSRALLDRVGGRRGEAEISVLPERVVRASFPRTYGSTQRGADR